MIVPVPGRRLGCQPGLDRLADVAQQLVHDLALADTAGQCRHLGPEPAFFGLVNDDLDLHGPNGTFTSPPRPIAQLLVSSRGHAPEASAPPLVTARWSRSSKPAARATPQVRREPSPELEDPVSLTHRRRSLCSNRVLVSFCSKIGVITDFEIPPKSVS
jgi:hypothetical protein